MVPHDPFLVALDIATVLPSIVTPASPDFAAEAHMEPDAAASDSSLYSDGTHPTAAGQVYLEPVWTAAVNSL